MINSVKKSVKRVPVPWKLVEHEPSVHSIRFSNVKCGQEMWALLISDEHWDNPQCRLDLLKKHHDEAVERGAVILKFGDTFCAMQGKYDKRSNKSDVRPEHKNGDYLDSLVKTAAQWFHPYRHNIAVIGDGNHETSISDRHETNLCDRLCEKLRDNGGITRHGGYAGWVRFQFAFDSTRKSTSKRLMYSHGSGGGGPVTKGLIDFNRTAEWTDADLLVSGHVHWKNLTPVMRCRLSDGNVPRSEKGFYIRCGSYKDEFNMSRGGFHIEKGRGPRPLGGWWVKFTRDRNDVETEVLEAI